MICGFSGECKISPTFETGSIEVCDKSGVIWIVLIPKNYLTLAAPSGKLGRMWVYQYITDRTQALYGFPTQESYTDFMALLTVDGIGPTAALRVLSSFSTEEFRMAVGSGNSNALSQAKGLGKKSAQKIVDKLQGSYSEFIGAGKASVGASSAFDRIKEAHKQAEAALSRLGFTTAEVAKKMRATEYTVDAFVGMSIEEVTAQLFRDALGK